MELTELSPNESWMLLRTAAVGRVGTIRAGLPSVVPVNVCAAEGAVWFRVGPGVLLDAALAGDVLTVEADEIDRMTHTGLERRRDRARARSRPNAPISRGRPGGAPTPTTSSASTPRS